MQEFYDVIVVGAGHAGMEAAISAAHLGMQTLCITLNKNHMAEMPCNPSIGGSAKGIVVREIDALGGMMGIAADQSTLQMKMLNTGKGPGVRCLRAQADKKGYPRAMKRIAENTENLTIIEGMVTKILHDDQKVVGVATEDKIYYSKKIILTTGTYMEAKVLRGHNSFSSGPDNEKPSLGLSQCLKEMGIELFRLKTGTPPRIREDSIHYEKLEPQYGTKGNYTFSYETEKGIPWEQQMVCYLTYTTEKTHEIIKNHLKDSAMYGGMIHGVGPRYCPSIEDKIVRFADKPRHQLFLEPESKEMNSVYLQGFSTSMPEQVQEEMVHSLPGLEDAVFLKYAYAIEYDAIRPLQLDASLMVKKWQGLYCAGQICGTSGYEEAAGLGLMAGINASRSIQGKEPIILRRDQAYIGVMIDDLISKGTEEPYRLMSSRAEYRLLMRHDNADRRLTPIGYEIGLISEKRYQKFKAKEENLKRLKEELKNYYLRENEALDAYLYQHTDCGLKVSTSAENLIKRPGVSLQEIKDFLPIDFSSLDENALFQLETEVKYEGYIQKEVQEAERMKKLESISLPTNWDYQNMQGLALEARQKLSKVQPRTLAQAQRIPGVNPADIAVLLMMVKRGKYESR